MDGSSPQFSVVIPTCHRNDLLALCLERLGPGRQKGMTLISANSSTAGSGQEGLRELGTPTLDSTYEVIVTDDGARSTAEAMIREHFPWARWTAGPRKGPAANRNHGANHAGGHWLVFTDDDCLPEPGWLIAYRSGITSNSGIQVMEGKTLATGEKQCYSHVAPINHNGNCFWSCNLALTTGAFGNLKGFNEAFPFNCMEDMDLGRRIVKSGLFCRFIPEALVLHPWRPHGGTATCRKQLISMRIFLRIHPDAESLFYPMVFMRGCAAYIREHAPPIFLRGEFSRLPHLLLVIGWNTWFVMESFTRRAIYIATNKT